MNKVKKSKCTSESDSNRPTDANNDAGTITAGKTEKKVGQTKSRPRPIFSQHLPQGYRKPIWLKNINKPNSGMPTSCIN